MGKSLQWRKC